LQQEVYNVGRATSENEDDVAREAELAALQEEDARLAVEVEQKLAEVAELRVQAAKQEPRQRHGRENKDVNKIK
jgi:hypothetical protein